MIHRHPRILVLGARGMVGHTLYAYLSHLHPTTVWGTHHEKFGGLLVFEGTTPDQAFAHVRQTTGPVDCVINTIGILKPAERTIDKSTFDAVNTELPLRLARMAQREGFRLIHLSTDGVFDPLAGAVNEDAVPSPIDIYGSSKLAGEPDNGQCLTIRTSVIGLDPNHRRGLLEWALTQTEISGYMNQRWSGCTSLQLAEFCEHLTTGKRKWPDQRLIHFAPLGPVSKYELLLSWVSMWPQKHLPVHPVKGSPVTRFLTTKNPTIHQDYKHDITQALAALVNYERGE